MTMTLRAVCFVPTSARSERASSFLALNAETSLAFCDAISASAARAERRPASTSAHRSALRRSSHAYGHNHILPFQGVPIIGGPGAHYRGTYARYRRGRCPLKGDRSPL